MPNVSDALRIIFISGLSGAGKSSAVDCLEDMGYYCVDNLPTVLVTKFVDLSLQAEGTLNKIAMVVDIRGREFFNEYDQALKDLTARGIKYHLLFLEASDESLVRRYKESRRLHPLAKDSSLLEAIRRERRIMADIRGSADVIIDTSNLKAIDLKQSLQRIYGDLSDTGMRINLISFGYKTGLPLNVDLVMDVRFLPNPFYDEKMRNMTGLDQPVIDYVLNSPVTQGFHQKFLELLKFLLPAYVREGKSNLVIAVGCTGGQHRSVVIAECLAEKIRDMGHTVLVRHRDIDRY